MKRNARTLAGLTFLLAAGLSLLGLYASGVFGAALAEMLAVGKLETGS